MRHMGLRAWLVVLTAFLALTTMAGAVFVVPGLPLEWLDGSVFTDYTVPAFALAFVGGLSIVALATLLVHREMAGWLACAAGLAMVGFELVEIWVVGFSVLEYGPAEPFAWLQVAYIAIGLVTAALGVELSRTVVVHGRPAAPSEASAASR